MLSEFKDFISRGNVIDLAVAVILGAAFTAIVNSLVADLINPLIGIFMGGRDLSQLFYVYGGGEFANLEAARESGSAVFAYGTFIMSIVNFIIIAFVVFILVKMINNIQKAKEEEADAGPSEIDLLTEIRNALKK